MCVSLHLSTHRSTHISIYTTSLFLVYIHFNSNPYRLGGWEGDAFSCPMPPLDSDSVSTPFPALYPQAGSVCGYVSVTLPSLDAVFLTSQCCFRIAVDIISSATSMWTKIIC